MAAAETAATGDNPTLSEGASVAAGKDVGKVAALSSSGENMAAPPSDGEAGAAGSGGEEEDELVEEDVENELDNSLRPDHRFFAVRALVEGGKTARKLNRRMKLPERKDEGFLLRGDERFFRNANDSSIERRVNVSASFMAHGKCNTCLNGTHDAWVGREG